MSTRWPRALLPLLLTTLPAGTTLAQPPAPGAGARPVLFYLHGRFVEEFGEDGISPEHGPYEYRRILARLRAGGTRVESERRPRDTDVSDYADRVVERIRELIEEGHRASDITVIGASKGSVIATLVSTRLDEADVRYVLMANCNAWLENTWHPRLHGRVLSIFEASDDLAGSCRALAARSKALTEFEEIELDTGLGHGFLYRPIDAWVEPALCWATRATTEL
jgi:pimeloyl-ACP methyl ester carboxylesterase